MSAQTYRSIIYFTHTPRFLSNSYHYLQNPYMSKNIYKKNSSLPFLHLLFFALRTGYTTPVLYSKKLYTADEAITAKLLIFHEFGLNRVIAI